MLSPRDTQRGQLMKSIKFSIILLMIGSAHFFNAQPCIEKLDIGQTMEQVEAIISQRKAIKTIHEKVQHKKQCAAV